MASQISGTPLRPSIPESRSDRHHQYQNIFIIPQSITNIHSGWLKKNIVIMDENMHVYLEQLAREAFKEFDKDNSGTIDQKVGSCILYMTI